MTDPTPDVPTLRRLLAEATPGPWKLWGMTVLADQDGTGNVDTAVPVAQTYFRDENDKPRTWDADLIAQMHNLLPGILDRLEAAEGAVARCAELADDLCDFNGGHGDYLSAGKSLRAALAEVTP